MPRPVTTALGLLLASVLTAAAVPAGAVVPLERATSAAVQVPPASQAAAAQRTYSYTVETRGGVTSDVGHFAQVAASTLADHRGWALGGHLGFTRVGSGGSFRLVLATPAAVDAASPGCSARWSCRVGELVLINEERWNTGAAAWTGTLHDYRHYVILHEVGHWLGLGHPSCPAPGEPAPVMQQQSISLDGCRASTWPAAWERARVAELHGISAFVRDAGALLQPGQQLVAAERLTSPSGRYRLDVQSDGNVVVRDGRRVRWHAGTHGRPGARLVMQGDGNLVVYAPGGRALWHSMTHGSPGARLVLQDDGNLVVYTRADRPLWHIGPDR